MNFIRRIEIRPKGAIIVYPDFLKHSQTRTEKGQRGMVHDLYVPRWRHNMNALDRV